MSGPMAQLIRRNLRFSKAFSLSFRMMSSQQEKADVSYTYETLKVTQARDKVLHVELNRPEKRNAMNQAFWREMVECFNKIAQDSDCHAVVLSGAGKVFTAGVDLITACDIRYCTQDAFISVKEVDIGMAADVGTLQRLPRIIGNQSLVNELTFTARKMMSEEAQSSGLVSRVFEDKEAMLKGAFEVASEIASKSPLAVQGSKVNLVYSRNHSVPEGLNYMATWNMSMLQTEDLMKSAMAAMEKKTPRDVVYSKL
ncbi:delta(3,5)-Delta(2,4)-dienoyl-CoA isomerase, mitochondrial-like isoform X3 [Lissotriton helveticus]